MFLSAVSPGFSVVLDPRSRLGGRGGNVGSACEDLRTLKVAYWFNVSESSGASSPVKWLLLLYNSTDVHTRNLHSKLVQENWH